MPKKKNVTDDSTVPESSTPAPAQPDNFPFEEAAQPILITGDNREENAVKAERDALGLVKGVTYKYKADGKIDWRAMIDPKYLAPNRESFPPETDLTQIDVSTLEDSKLIILLQGLIDLAFLRGFEHVESNVISASPNYAAVQTIIHWLPNYETKNRVVAFPSSADAHPDNTFNFARDYLLTIAENRSFGRAVRRFLGINIVSNAELGSKKPNATPEPNQAPVKEVKNDPISLLAATLKRFDMTFAQIKSKGIAEKVAGAENWKTIQDVDPATAVSFVERIKKVKEAAK